MQKDIIISRLAGFLLFSAVHAGCGPSCPKPKGAPLAVKQHPSRTAPANRLETDFLTIRNKDADPRRLHMIKAALDRCVKGLKRFFPSKPRPLTVMAYGKRASFEAGLMRELGFDRRTASYFGRGGAPRPMRGKLLVPASLSMANICHELVHHYLESHVPTKALMKAKWFDEGTASYLAALIFGQDLPRMIAWFKNQHSYLPFMAMRTQESWASMHHHPRLRRLSYLEAMSLMKKLFDTYGVHGFKKVLLRTAGSGSVDKAIKEVTGSDVFDLFTRWSDSVLADWGRRPFDRGRSASFLLRAEPDQVGLDPAAVRRLIGRAVETRSDSLLVIKDGRMVVERHFLGERGPIETMSVTKSIVSLAVGLLLSEGRIRSVDTPMHTWFDEWKKDGRSAVTLKHVLTHTSGLSHPRAAGLMMRKADRTAHARSRPLAFAPGTRFSYSNEASQLLSEVVRAASGVPLDLYLKRKLFDPLSIKGYRWERDPSGNVQAFYGLALSARDLARIGLLMLASGRHLDKQLVPGSWVLRSVSPGIDAFPMMGYLWWIRHGSTRWVQRPARLGRLAKEDMPGASRLRPLNDRLFKNPGQYWLEAGARLRPPQRRALARWIEQKDSPVVRVPHDRIGYNANGWQGQYLAVYPKWNLVVVRQRRPIRYDEMENRRFGFFDFFKLCEAMIRKTTGHRETQRKRETSRKR